mgnify:FL=1
MQKSFILTASNNRRQLTFLIKTKKKCRQFAHYDYQLEFLFFFVHPRVIFLVFIIQQEAGN